MELKVKLRWPSCTHNPKTLSFRSPSDNETAFRGTHSRLFFDPSTPKDLLPPIGSENDTITLVAESNCLTGSLFEESSVTVAMDSDDPFMDFSRSMEEMVGAHDGILGRWDYLEELLALYLSVNGKDKHCFIVGAFVGLLAKFSSPNSRSSQECSSSSSCVCVGKCSPTSFSSAGSSFSSDQEGC